jgi:predicted ATP-grasp superfamily ATP-dependent carboligase
VTGIASDPNDFGLRSRYLAERHLTTEEDDERTLSLLRDASREARPIFFPERDENVHFVVRRWDEVRELADMPMPDDVETVLRLRRKDRLRVEAERVGISIPMTATPKDESDLRNLDFPPPYLIKAVTGQELAYAFGHKVFVADDADSAVGLLAPGRRPRVRDGRPGADPERVRADLLALQLHRPRWTTARQCRRAQGASGAAPLRYKRRLPRPAGAACARARSCGLLESVGYRGFAQVEFAYDERDDEFKLLEVNTRPPMWAGVAMSRYFDIARIAYDDLSGRRPRSRRRSPDEVAWVYFAKDAWVGLQMLRGRELSPRAFVAPYLRRRKVASTLAVDDPLPAVASLRYLRSKLAVTVVVDGDRQIGRPLPGEVLPHPLPPAAPRRRPQLLVVEQPLQGRAQRADVAGLDEESRLLVDDEIEETSDRSGDDRPAVRHRLGADNTEALPCEGTATTAARS